MWLWLLACTPNDAVDGCRDPSARDEQPYDTERIGADWPVSPDHDTVDWAFLQGARGVSIADFDGDGVLDMLVPREGFETRLLVGRGNSRFRDRTDEAFAEPLVVQALASVAADVEGDGDMDAVLYGIRTEPILLFNDGAGHFQPVELSWWNIDDVDFGCGGVVTLADFDRDGDLDAFYGRLGGTDPLGNDAPLACRSALFRNDGTGEFVADDRVGLPDVQGIRVVGGAWHDFDRDGWIDLYAITDRPPARNALLRNREGIGFTAPQGLGLDLAVWSMGIGIADLNRDGTPDITIPDILGIPTLLSRPDGGWIEGSDAMGLTLDRDRQQAIAWGGEYVDLDNDGLEDLVVTYSPAAASERGFSARDQPDEVYRQGEDLIFAPVAEAWGLDDRRVNRGVVSADLDGDGWMDLVTRELGGLVTVHRARCGAAAWLGVELADPTSGNPSAIGARVVVHADGTTQERTVHAGGVSYSVSGPPSVHFGLGEVEQVDRIEVHWPDGTVSESGPHPARQWLTLER